MPVSKLDVIGAVHVDAAGEVTDIQAGFFDGCEHVDVGIYRFQCSHEDAGVVAVAEDRYAPMPAVEAVPGGVEIRTYHPDGLGDAPFYLIATQHPARR